MHCMAYEGPLMCKVSVESARSPENASPAAARSRVFAIFADRGCAAKSRDCRHARCKGQKIPGGNWFSTTPPEFPTSASYQDPQVPGRVGPLCAWELQILGPSSSFKFWKPLKDWNRLKHQSCTKSPDFLKCHLNARDPLNWSILHKCFLMCLACPHFGHWHTEADGPLRSHTCHGFFH